MCRGRPGSPRAVPEREPGQRKIYPSLAVSKSRGIRVSRCPSLAASESRCIRVSRHPSLAGSEPRSIRVDPARTAAGLPGRIRVVICPAQHAAAGVITSGTSWMPRCTTRVSFLHLDFFQVSSFNFSCPCLFMVQHNLDAPLYYLGHHTPLYDLDAPLWYKMAPGLCQMCPQSLGTLDVMRGGQGSSSDHKQPLCLSPAAGDRAAAAPPRRLGWDDGSEDFRAT